MAALTENEWQDFATHEVAIEIGGFLEAWVVLSKPVRDLTLDELKAVASAAIGKYIVLRQERELQQFKLSSEREPILG